MCALVSAEAEALTAIGMEVAYDYDVEGAAQHSCSKGVFGNCCSCRLWGDVVKWGSSFHTNTPGECCEACLKHTPAKHSAHKCNGKSVQLSLAMICMQQAAHVC